MSARAARNQWTAAAPDGMPTSRRLCLLLAALLAPLAPPPARAAPQDLSNVVPRRETSGAILDAHDGNIVWSAATSSWLYFAAGYGPCEEPAGLNGCADWSEGTSCGFFKNHSVNVYETTDFTTWRAHGNVLPLGAPRPDAVLFSPKAVFNAKTQLWVLWCSHTRVREARRAACARRAALTATALLRHPLQITPIRPTTTPSPSRRRPSGPL